MTSSTEETKQYINNGLAFNESNMREYVTEVVIENYKAIKKRVLQCIKCLNSYAKNRIFQLRPKITMERSQHQDHHPIGKKNKVQQKNIENNSTNNRVIRSNRI